MSNWITLTTGNVPTYLANQATAKGLSLGNIINAVAVKIRNAIASHVGNILSATPNSIPPELLDEAIALIEKSASRLPGISVSKDVKEDAAAAEEQLDRIAKGIRRVTIPTDPESTPEVQGGPSMSTVRPNRPRANHHNLRGL